MRSARDPNTKENAMNRFLITLTLTEGKQYVAVSVGNSLASSSINRLAEKLHPGNASNVFVFTLPQ